ncbi:MAG: ligase-associated DNA damage response endonuclease PdeM [Ideonella sp. WA131b]|nr:ligase-associated DNA damage response endonuclease PdeM [Ideonella sp. WA131b]
MSPPEHHAGGARLVPLPERALWLPEVALLLVADVHIGKAQSFRRLGVPVPEATTAGTLSRLDAALARCAATGRPVRGIVFLGDLLHAARGRGAAPLAAVTAWRERHAALSLTLVRGNHDGHAGDPPADWRVACVDEPWQPCALPGLALCHHPDAQIGRYVLAGHLHPAVVLGGRAHQRLRLPCFHFGPAVGVLPAFGEFTGMRVLPRGPADRVFACTSEAVVALPAPP